jgi:2-phosphoglycolate phosphatase
MPIKAVLFDLDGTLLDTAPDFVIAMNELADEYSVSRVTAEKIQQTVSDGARALTSLLFNLQEKDAGFAERRQRLLDIYYLHMGEHCVLFDGIYNLLTHISHKQLAWGVITNKPVRFAQPIMNGLKLPQQPDVLICPDHVVNTKPDPEPLIKACRQLNCQAHEIIYIGDHKRDIDCGINAGSATIAVSYGYIHESDNIKQWQADYIVHHANEIWPIITSKL